MLELKFEIYIFLEILENYLTYYHREDHLEATTPTGTTIIVTFEFKSQIIVVILKYRLTSLFSS